MLFTNQLCKKNYKMEKLVFLKTILLNKNILLVVFGFVVDFMDPHL